MGRPRGPLPIHGSRSRYQLRGDPCRCPHCQRANRRYMATYRAARRDRQVQLRLPREYLTGWDQDMRDTA